jgi:gamma-glutamyl:cysteine ligase YbdK (ATP-grasp superfamily)
VEHLVEQLSPTAAELGCASYLQHCRTIAESPSAAQRQIDLLEETSDPREVVRQLSEASRLSAVPASTPLRGGLGRG